MVCVHYDTNLSFNKIRDNFSVNFPERPVPAKSTIREIVKRFDDGVIDPRILQIRQPNRALSFDLKSNICKAVVEDSNISLSEI